MKLPKQFAALCGLAALLLTGVARAGVTFVLTPSAQTGLGSNEVFFTGTLTNTGAGDLYLNGLQVSFECAATNYLAADTNVFFANVPGILLPGETYNQSLVFGVAIAPTTPPGQYSGAVTVEGGTNIFAATSLVSVTFEISLPPASIGIAGASTNLALSWPSPPGGFVLQENSNLSNTNWTTVTNASALSNGLNQVDLSPGAGAQFYRLEYP